MDIKLHKGLIFAVFAVIAASIVTFAHLRAIILAKKEVGPLASPARLPEALLGPLAAIPDIDNREEAFSKADQLLLLDDNKHNTTSAITSTNSNHPVLFVPGLFGNVLETKLLADHQKPHWWLPGWLFPLCAKSNKTYKTAWLPTLLDLFPFVIDCFADSLQLKWNFVEHQDNNNNSSSSSSSEHAQKLPWQAGIDTRPKPTFDSVELIYGHYAEKLTQLFGYQPDQNMIAQPFDWRVGPETWMQPGQEFQQMKKKIEDIVHKNHGRKVVAMSISAGGPFFALFLNHYVDQKWKDKHIHVFFSVSGAFSGSALAPMQYLSLQHNSFFPDGLPNYISSRLANVIRTTSSVSWLFPFPDSFHGTVISTPSKQYRAHELGDALKVAGHAEQARLYSINRKYYGGTRLVPGVRTYCMSGFGVPTMTSVRYNTDNMSDPPIVDSFDDGDNCVTVECLRQCDAWADRQAEPVHSFHYYNESHAGLLYHPDVVQKFLSLVAGKDAEVEEELASKAR